MLICAKESRMGFENLFNSSRDLFEQVCAEDNLHLAFASVKRNRGVSGVDGITIEMYSENLSREISKLAEELQNWKYKPKPVKCVEIPKSDGKSTRKLGIPCVRDRVVQACLKMILEPIFDPLFSENSYGFRPGRNQEQAVLAAQSFVKEGKEWVVDVDLEKFFDTISHDKLIYRMSLQVKDTRIHRLLGNILRSGVQVGNIVEETLEGSVQGSPLSPLLSNIVLDELDKELEKRKLVFVRFADDNNIFVRSEKAAQRIMLSITKFIENKLKLKVNQSKSKVALSKHVKFLGMTIISGTRAISAKSMKNAHEKLKELLPTNSPMPVQKSIAKLNVWFRGWAEYFSMTQYPSQLLVIEAHARRRLRARIVKQCKRKANLQRRLVSFGLKRKSVAKSLYGAIGPWKLSHHLMQRAYDVAWFTEKGGQYIHSSKGYRHWFSRKKWIQLI
jgi:RNA-directed DNA polymerase